MHVLAIMKIATNSLKSSDDKRKVIELHASSPLSIGLGILMLNES
jgi:hypothetical protein